MLRQILISIARQSHATNSKSSIPMTRIDDDVNDDEEKEEEDDDGGDDDVWIAGTLIPTPLPS